MPPKKKNEGENPKDQNAEEILKSLPNDLGNLGSMSTESTSSTEDGAIVLTEGIPLFDNDDIDDEGNMSKDEIMAMIRLFPPEAMSDYQGVAATDLYEMAMDKIYELCGIVAQQYEMRITLEEMGANTTGDLDVALLSVVGEMGRLRTLVPKLAASIRKAQDTEEEN